MRIADRIRCEVSSSVSSISNTAILVGGSDAGAQTTGDTDCITSAEEVSLLLLFRAGFASGKSEPGSVGEYGLLRKSSNLRESSYPPSVYGFS